MRNRNDDTAAAEEAIYRNALEKQGDRMDADTKARFLEKLASARGQLTNARERAEAEKKNKGGANERV